MDVRKPGYCGLSTNKKIGQRRRKDILRFIESYESPIGYVGLDTFLKIKYMDCIISPDYNKPAFNKKKYKTILCFEILEHLQNPLYFLEKIKEKIAFGGVLYLSTPHRPKFLWPDYHFNEMSGKHIQKWLLNPLDLKIVRSKKLYINGGLKTYLIGFRPLYRAIKNLNFKPIISNLTNTTWIYEIR